MEKKGARGEMGGEGMEKVGRGRVRPGARLRRDRGGTEAGPGRDRGGTAGVP